MTKHPTDLRQVSALLKWALTEAPGYQVVADYGAGTGTLGPELAKSSGKTLYRYDPSLPKETNQELFDNIYQADVLISANVLNVLVNDQELIDAIRWILDLAGRTKTGTAIVTSYKAPKPSKTQRAQPLSWYFDLIKKEARLDTHVDIHGGKIWITRK